MTDREEIFDFIEGDNPRAAIATDNRIEAVVDLLADSPLIGRSGRVEGTRELPVSQTPYIVAYIVDGQRVRVLRVIHGAQVGQKTWRAYDPPQQFHSRCTPQPVKR